MGAVASPGSTSWPCPPQRAGPVGPGAPSPLGGTEAAPRAPALPTRVGPEPFLMAGLLPRTCEMSPDLTSAFLPELVPRLAPSLLCWPPVGKSRPQKGLLLLDAARTGIVWLCCPSAADAGPLVPPPPPPNPHCSPLLVPTIPLY